MIIAGYDFPDTCPKDCEFIDDIANYGQSAVCVTCPVFSCSGPDPIVRPEDYRADWAATMHRTVVGKAPGIPILPLAPGEAEPDAETGEGGTHGPAD
jgi:hypothetical protein